MVKEYTKELVPIMSCTLMIGLAFLTSYAFYSIGVVWPMGFEPIALLTLPGFTIVGTVAGFLKIKYKMKSPLKVWATCVIGLMILNVCGAGSNFYREMQIYGWLDSPGYLSTVSFQIICFSGLVLPLSGMKDFLKSEHPRLRIVSKNIIYG